MKAPNSENTYIETNTIEASEEDYLYIKLSQIQNAGNGLYTAINIYKNEVITIFKGEILNAKEAEERTQQNNDKYFINLLDGTILDSMHIDCFAKYANDTKGLSDSPFKNNAKIILDDDNNVCIKATKKIKSREEIFCGYGKAYWKRHG